MGRPLVEVDAVSRVFTSGAARHTAIEDVSFQVAEGEFLATVVDKAPAGENG